MYYKITNDNEKHRGLKYHKGLNIDPVPFNPSGDCEPGGIYFTDVENILAFCWAGTNLREVFLPEDAKVYPPLEDAVSSKRYENPGEPKKWKADKVILGKKFKLWTKETLEKLISEGADVHASHDCALQWASKNGHVEVVKLLLEAGADIHACHDWALEWASGNGQVEVVKLLLEAGADVHACNDWALRWASQNGCVEVVKLLKEAIK